VNELKETEDLLERGKWVVESIDVPLKTIKNGIVFSKDKQVFYVDSQGKLVPSLREIVYEVKQDTLRIVDFKYSLNKRFEKGTTIGVIRELNEETLTLDLHHPEKNTIVFVNQDF
jgi:hypothetical protein